MEQLIGPESKNIEFWVSGTRFCQNHTKYIYTVLDAKKHEKSKNLKIFKIFEIFFWFWWISNWCLFMVFKAILMIKGSKIISMIRRIHWRALQGCARGCARAETAPPPGHTWKKWEIHHITVHICWRATRAQPRARPSSAHQSILLIMEIIFDCLIVIISLKATYIPIHFYCMKMKNFSFFQKWFSKSSQNSLVFYYFWGHQWCLFRRRNF